MGEALAVRVDVPRWGEREFVSKRSMKPQTQRGVVVGMLQELAEVRAQEQSVRSFCNKITNTADFAPGARRRNEGRGTRDPREGKRKDLGSGSVWRVETEKTTTRVGSNQGGLTRSRQEVACHGTVCKHLVGFLEIGLAPRGGVGGAGAANNDMDKMWDMQG